MSNPTNPGQRSGSGLKTPEPSRAESSPAVARRLTPRQEAVRRRARKRRRNRLILTGVLVAVTAAAMIAIGVSINQPINFKDLPGAATPNERAFELGPADARVTVESYIDLQCPACKSWEETNVPRLQNDYINAGKSVRFVFKPIAILDARYSQRESHITAEAAYCAGEQSRSADYINAVYRNQPNTENSGFWNTDRLKELARVLKLDSARFNSCVDSNKYRNQVNTDTAVARDKGVNATPTIFVNGTQLATNDWSAVQKAIDEGLVSPNK